MEFRTTRLDNAVEKLTKAGAGLLAKVIHVPQPIQQGVSDFAPHALKFGVLLYQVSRMKSLPEEARQFLPSSMKKGMTLPGRSKLALATAGLLAIPLAVFAATRNDSRCCTDSPRPAAHNVSSAWQLVPTITVVLTLLLAVVAWDLCLLS